ncbi:LPP20 family lipoprotein [Helicobacter pametensis]|uniref:LPP20 family lipoprotein n=1 Tax=Helicobacter pametensis TaxID=95149 RepID=UPI0004813ADF|nr:LPP20 family lipoprotein [Helicobacter pametensis]
MRSKVIYSGMIGIAALGLSGCGAFSDGVSDTALIPPSANYQANYVPLQPPMVYSQPSGNMMPQESMEPQVQRVNKMVIDSIELPALPEIQTPPPSQKAPTQMAKPEEEADSGEPMIPNSPMLTANNTIELSAVGMGVAPETSVSPSQALALAKRAAIVDAYRQIGEKMYGIRVNGQDTVKDMMLQNSVVKTKVQALIRNAEITETVYKDGLCQVSMELKLDGKVWHKVLSGKF